MPDTRKPKTKAPTGPAAKQAAKAGQAAKPKPGSKGKLAKGAAARRLEARRRRQRTLLWTGTVVVVVAALVGFVVWQGRGPDDKVSAAALTQGRQAAGCGGVKQFPQASAGDHIRPDQQPRDWNSNPPTSGQHLDTPLRPGVYDVEQDQRAVVHNLEHGYVVLEYKNLPADQVKELRDFVQERSGSKLLLTPNSGLDSDGVALAAWQNLETCQRVNLDVVKAFVNDFMVPGATRSTAPEPLGA
jgi:Protein of unknown function (DUF3105)